jgi:hypothetical protein
MFESSFRGFMNVLVLPLLKSGFSRYVQITFLFFPAWRLRGIAQWTQPEYGSAMRRDETTLAVVDKTGGVLLSADRYGHDDLRAYTWKALA